MSIECGECEHDIRGGHDPSCSRYLDQCVGELHDVATTIQADDEGLETEHVKAIREYIRYLERMARGNVDRLVNAAARDLPSGYQMSVYTENGAGYVEAWDVYGDQLPVDTADRSIEDQIRETVDLALNHAAYTAAEREAE